MGNIATAATCSVLRTRVSTATKAALGVICPQVFMRPHRVLFTASSAPEVIFLPMAPARSVAPNAVRGLTQFMVYKLNVQMRCWKILGGNKTVG